jgi:hypothetical protein
MGSYIFIDIIFQLKKVPKNEPSKQSFARFISRYDKLFKI